MPQRFMPIGRQGDAPTQHRLATRQDCIIQIGPAGSIDIALASYSLVLLWYIMPTKGHSGALKQYADVKGFMMDWYQRRCVYLLHLFDNGGLARLASTCE